MKKYDIKINNMHYKNHYLIDSIDSYRDYMLELNNRFAVSESEIKNLKTFMGHGYSLLTGICGALLGMSDSEENREKLLFNLKLLHGRVVSDQLKHIINGNKLVINDKGGYFHIKPNEKYESVEMVNCNYTENDIKIKKWWGGNHYYAKIRNIDVVDDEGNVKWNTEKSAYDASEKFLEKLNNK